MLRFVVKCNVGLSFSFDEVYYGQYISLYMKRVFFVDGSGPPLGHMLLALGGRSLSNVEVEFLEGESHVLLLTDLPWFPYWQQLGTPKMLPNGVVTD